MGVYYAVQRWDEAAEKWRTDLVGQSSSRRFCEGFLAAIQGMYGRPAYRLVKAESYITISSGKVIVRIPGKDRSHVN